MHFQFDRLGLFALFSDREMSQIQILFRKLCLVEDHKNYKLLKLIKKLSIPAVEDYVMSEITRKTNSIDRVNTYVFIIEVMRSIQSLRLGFCGLSSHDRGEKGQAERKYHHLLWSLI